MASPWHQVVAATNNILQRSSGSDLELAEVADAAALAEVQRLAVRLLELLGAGARTETFTGPTVEAVCSLTKQCLTLAARAGLSSIAVCILVGHSLSAAAALLLPRGCLDHIAGSREQIAAVLEPVGEAMDGFAVDIFAGILRLEEILEPQWIVRACGQGGHVVFGIGADFDFSTVDSAPDNVRQYHRDVQLYHALQGVCLWALALAIRLAGHQQFNARFLWEYATRGPLGVQVVSKCALSFQTGELYSQSGRPVIPVPEDLPELQDAIIGAVLGLTGQDVAFASCKDIDDGSVAIEVRNETLRGHHARLAAAAEVSGLLSCVLAYPWVLRPGAASRLPALASFLSTLASAKVTRPPHVVKQVESWRNRLLSCAHDIWSLLLSEHQVLPCASRGFLRDCAALAAVTPPLDSQANTLVDGCLSADQPHVLNELLSDSLALAALVVFFANSGYSPGTDWLTVTLAKLDLDSRASVSGRLTAWQGPLRDGVTLSAWIQYLNTPHCQPIYDDGSSATPTFSEPAAESAGVASVGTEDGLREIVCDAPAEFRCVLDGRLLLDPVRSPLGHVFERSVLLRALQASAGKCPITGVPLEISECPRDSALRLRVLRWVQQSRPRQPQV